MLELGFPALESEKFWEPLGLQMCSPKYRTSAANSIHLARAAAIGVDLFLTGDKDLRKLHIPGIKFIDGIDTQLL
jgi:hypothetical protein